jgi:16S rRNA (cytosine1407-C5)-methyltransferase
MIPPLVLSPASTDIVMDTCSAPGSKATRMAELMDNRGTLIVNESNLDRVKILVHNIDKTSLVNIGVIRNRAEFLSQVYDNHFDKILVDAPCSALGVLQKKGEVSNWWSLERVNNITPVQYSILTAAVKMVKTGGEIVYSTCTLTVEENEIIINQILDKYPVEVTDINLPVKNHEGFTAYGGKKLNSSLQKACRILPWEVDSEGFFIVKLKKTGDTVSVKKPSAKGDNLKLLTFRNIEKYFTQLTDHFGIDSGTWTEYQYLLKGTEIFFINKDWNDENLNTFTRIGIQLGIIDKNDTAHLYTFGAQHLGNKITKKIYTLTAENQIKDYLNGNIVKTGEQLSGQYVVKFNDYILGTAVGVNNGLKNQYPKSSRIHEISCF